MLEALVKAKIKSLNKELEVKSAGLCVQEGDKVNEKARKAVKTKGIVIRHKPTMLTSKALERADSIITMTDEHKQYLSSDKCFYKVFSLREAVGYNVCDPYGLEFEGYLKCMQLLDNASDVIVENLIKAGKI